MKFRNQTSFQHCSSDKTQSAWWRNTCSDADNDNPTNKNGIYWFGSKKRLRIPVLIGRIV